MDTDFYRADVIFEHEFHEFHEYFWHMDEHGFTVRMLFLNTNFTNILGTWMDSGFTVRMVIDEHEYLESRIFLGTRILTLSLQKIFV